MCKIEDLIKKGIMIFMFVIKELDDFSGIEFRCLIEKSDDLFDLIK